MQVNQVMSTYTTFVLYLYLLRLQAVPPPKAKKKKKSRPLVFPLHVIIKIVDKSIS
jgi:hypothetical protein